MPVLCSFTVRPSGTEPKIKMYFEVVGQPCSPADLPAERDRVTAIRQAIEKTFMKYCYRLIEVDFPSRGFLLFWQLPLADKLKYFQIEEDIAALREITAAQDRRAKLNTLLAFLGANPIKKINKAFKARYDSEVLQYLNLDDQ